MFEILIYIAIFNLATQVYTRKALLWETLSDLTYKQLHKVSSVRCILIINNNSVDQF